MAAQTLSLTHQWVRLWGKTPRITGCWDAGLHIFCWRRSKVIITKKYAAIEYTAKIF